MRSSAVKEECFGGFKETEGDELVARRFFLLAKFSGKDKAPCGYAAPSEDTKKGEKERDGD